MNRLLILVCLCLGGCLTSGKRGGDAPMAVYDLGMPAARMAPAESVPPLALEVRAPHWLDSLAVEYRLAYAETARLRDYALARWAGTPASLIQQRLVQQFGYVHQGQLEARCVVRVEVDEFSQVFATPGDSQGALHARVVLLDRSRSRTAERVVRIHKPAPSPDSRGGVAALTVAVEELGIELASWQGELLAQGKLKGCHR